MPRPAEVDYTATSLRPTWDTLPAALHEALTVALGTDITEVGQSVGSGFTGGFAAPAHLADGRRVFIKASDETLHSYDAYQREAEVVPHLPKAANAPAIITTAHAEDDLAWFAVVSEWVEGRMPGSPWTPADFDVVTATCEGMAAAMEPSPLDGLGSFAGLVGDDVGVPAQILAGERPFPSRLQEWVPKVLPELAELAQLAPEALQGDTAAHSDLRADNILIGPDSTCWIVDWNWLTLAPRWVDWAGLLPIAQHDGIDTFDAVRRSPLTADVPDDHLDAFMALIAAYMMKNTDAPPPPGCTPALREHQRFYAWTYLDWLAVRRNWG
ncbi:aminoglycoside phosphotransferase [Kribbella sp. NPDC026611]|uniref:phosphotransferase family protein n=1 Tax=Kribbella sp. NPDC026611 TaxID=3154911 RepID=UPI00340FC7F9